MGTQAFNADTGVSVGSSASLVIDANRNANFANVSANLGNFSGNVSTTTLNTGLVSGPAGSGYVANSAGGSASIAYASQYIFGTSNFTIEFWIKPNTYAASNLFLTGPAIAFYYDGSGNIVISMSSNGSAWDISDSQLYCTTSIGAWSHIALVRNGSNFTLYKDGTNTNTVSSALGIYNPAGIIDLLTGFNGFISNYRVVIGTAVYTTNFTVPNTTLTSTQSANVNGNPSAAITGTQTKLLTFLGSSITDSSSYNVSISYSGISMASMPVPFGQPQGTLIYNGTVWVASPITVGGNVTASYFLGDGGYLTNISAGGSSLNVSQYTTGTISNIVSNVDNLLFDTTTGFSVTDLGNGDALIQLGSSFKTWEVAGQTSLVAVGEDTVQFIAGSGITITTNASVIPQQITFTANLGNISDNEISNGTSNVSIPTANGNVFISVNGNANIAVISGTGANINGTLTVSNTVTISNTAGGATNIALGSPSQGNLVSNAISFTTDSTVSNAIAQLNTVLGKLVPPSPPNFPASQSVTINSLSSYRMANYVQTDNTPGANKSVAGGTTVSTVTRLATYATSNIANAGPGDSGTIVAYLNGSNAGGRTLTTSLNGNGTYSNLVIFNNVDYNTVNANIAAGFWSVFSSRAAGTITQGWNEVYIADSATSNTNTANWFYDSSSPGTPTFSSLAITAPVSPTYTYSSTVPHYANTNNFTIGFNCTRLSGNMYPVSDTFVTGTAGGAFAAPTSVTYATAGVTTPLAQNLYVSSGSQAVSTTSSIVSGFGASTIGPNVNVLNSYATGTQSFTTTLGANVLYKTGTVSSATVIQEANVYISSTIGVGSGLAFRILNPGASNTPYFTGNETAFDSQSSLLRVYDATVVANVLKHDQTNYSTGYLPVGPDLSSGRSGTQYFTFKIVRTSVSKFDVGWSGNIAGLWVALPGSTIDNTSTANGWLDMTVSYAGAGVPGANVAAGGNGSDGSALGGTAPINTVQTNKFVTATFGTVSSSSTAQNEIYIRVGLTSGQTVTALSLKAASN